MPPARFLHMRGGSLSPHTRTHDTSVIKVGGEVYDRDGYRMDVTVWFRHRNEVLYYLDSGGSMHGPMDQKHSTRLGNISRSGTLIPGSRHYIMESSHQTRRRRSDAGVWESRSEAYAPSTHLSRWASLQNTGSGWRGSSSNRYTTTLTRQHIRRQRDPVEVVVRQAPSAGASKVDLVSIDNRRDWQSERERRLYEELNNTRRELQQFKRSHSLTGEHHLLSPPPPQRIKSTSSQYLNESSWATHTLKKNDGLPCGARVAVSPHRTTSHSYLDGRNDFDNKRWVSEVSLGGRYRIPPQKDGYSAKRVNEQRRMQNISRADRQMESNRYGVASVSDFLEDISLEPIGAGVHDLDRPQGSVSRSVRGNTPTGSRTPGYDQADAFRTAGTSHMHREVHQFSGAASPMFAQHNSYQEQSSIRGMDRRFPGSIQSVPHGRASTVPPNYAGSMSGLNGFGNRSERETELMARVKATYLEWYLPHKSREAVESVLREMEPGSFIIRNSVSRAGSFALAIRAPDDISRTSGYSKSGPVKHFFITTVTSSDGRNDGVQLFGFENQAIFPNLVSFVFHHCIHPCAFPCTLRLPANQSLLRAYGSLDRYRSQMSNSGDGGIRADMVYLGNHYVDRLEGEAAIRQAVSHVLRKVKDNQQGLPDRSDVTVDVRPQTGIQIAGRSRQGIVDIRIQPHKILYSAIDPENRIYADEGLRNRQMYHAKLFGIVVRSKNLLMHGKKVHVFAEFDPNQSAHILIQYISNHFGR